MTEPLRKELLWLNDMKEAIEKIQAHPQYPGGREAFEDDEYFRVWVFYHLERIGECATQLRKQFDYDTKHPDIDWKEIVGTRRHLVHWYWAVDHDIIWDSVKKDLPLLHQKVQKLIREREHE